MGSPTTEAGGAATKRPPSPEEPYSDRFNRRMAEQLAAAAKAQTRMAEEATRRQKENATKAAARGGRKPNASKGGRQAPQTPPAKEVTAQPTVGGKEAQVGPSSHAGEKRRLQKARSATALEEAINQRILSLRQEQTPKQRKRSEYRKRRQAKLNVNPSTERASAEAQEQELERAPAEAQGEEAALGAPPPATHEGVGSEGQIVSMEDAHVGAVRTPVSNEEVWEEVVRVRALRAEAQQATLRLEEQRIAAEANAAAGVLQAVQLEGGRGSAEEGMGEEMAEEGGVEPGGSTGEGHRALEAARSTGLGVVVEEKEERREETAAPHEDQVEHERGGEGGGDGGGG